MLKPFAQLFTVLSGPKSGIYNMAFDDALLEWVCAQSASTLIVRTYRWQEPTLSLGVHQKLEPSLLALQPTAQTPFVRRPTGGRAILHGQDVSFAFVTNHLQLLRQSINDSYAFFTCYVKEACLQFELPLTCSRETNQRAYVAASACFQTQTPSDLLNAQGKKVIGSAQVRRKGQLCSGLLQHGSAFLTQQQGFAEQVDQGEALFHQALVSVITAQTGLSHQPFETVPDFQDFQASLAEKNEDYNKESAGILDNVSTMSGSHLLPTS